MSITLAGYISIDSVRTPKGEVDGLLGGSGIYSANSASLLTKVNLITIVGSDFPKDGFKFLRSKSVDLDGIQIIDGGITVRTKYFYSENSNTVVDSSLNVFKRFKPRIPKSYTNCNFLLLSAIDPDIQLMILNKVGCQRAVVVNNISHWLNSKRDKLLSLLNKIDILLLNEKELSTLTDEYNIIKAGKALLSKGIRYLIVKQGIHGAVIFAEDNYFSIPAYPVDEIVDITGVGDSFAGALVSYLDKKNALTFDYLKEALIYAVILSSFCIEDFGIHGINNITLKDVKKRYKLFKSYTSLPSIRV